MCPGGYPIQESQNWQAGFLPGVYQGTYIDTQHTQIEKLIEHVKNGQLSGSAQRKQLDLLLKLNKQHQAARPGDPQLEARLQSFELAYRMQAEATDAFDVTREPKHIRDAYGPGTQARQLLITRRLIERGVRFVQVWHGAGQPWDNHDDLEVNHRQLAKQCDQAIGALLQRSETARAYSTKRWSSGAANSAARRPSNCQPPARTPARSMAATTTITASRCGWPAAA